ncbi:hypothetical protein L1987_52982 [Smallanthus sonchifolius]|uniref:Uncharacterized protein n=1 Tax=Smallanthus sonchifolius TaxID=185202 RepID=A0ACB9EVT8_9ASTR|nr:hypothetical protein L1987_52982 [Smallanthus sonchifolius]
MQKNIQVSGYQVRELGKILDVPVTFLIHHQFPGPGLDVRIPCDETQGNALDFLRQETPLMVGNAVAAGAAYAGRYGIQA